MTGMPRKFPDIYAPELMTRPQRTRDTVITAIMWIAYLYLWVPLISLFAWLLGFELAYDVMIRTGGASGLDRVLIGYAIAIAAILAIVMAWSLGNRLRYGKLLRRKPVPDVTLEAMARYFSVDPRAAVQLRTTSRMDVEFDEAGRPLITPRGKPSWPGCGSAKAANSASSSHA